MTPTETAEALNVDESALVRAAHAGGVPYRQVADRMLFDPVSVTRAAVEHLLTAYEPTPTTDKEHR